MTAGQHPWLLRFFQHMVHTTIHFLAAIAKQWKQWWFTIGEQYGTVQGSDRDRFMDRQGIGSSLGIYYGKYTVY